MGRICLCAAECEGFDDVGERSEADDNNSRVLRDNAWEHICTSGKLLRDLNTNLECVNIASKLSSHQSAKTPRLLAPINLRTVWRYKN